MEITKSELRSAFITERAQLISFIQKASESDLDHPSLCSGWSNRNVIGHIIGFENRLLDLFLLIFRRKSLDEINETQANRYEAAEKQTYIRLLQRGLKRTLLLIRMTPNSILNNKLIPVPNGKISLAQLYGDATMDRAVHYLDIAAPLGITNEITEESAMQVAVKFVLTCVDLLNPKIPQKFYGHFMKLELTGLYAKTFYWRLGTDTVTELLPKEAKVILTAASSTNDLLFTITARPSLLKKPLRVSGDAELEKIIRNSFNAKALWEG